MATTDRYREGLGERLGRIPQRLRYFLTANTVDPAATLWLHAVSVGEVLAATRLVSELEAAGFRIVLSTTTRTGQQLARARFGADRVFYFPFDFASAIRPYLELLQPQALILMESELWPRLLHECAARSIPVVVANARVSDRSFARSMRFRSLWQRMGRHVTLWLAQSDEDARRLTTLLGTRLNTVISTGAERSGKTPALTAVRTAGNIRVTGNLKYDILAPQQSRIAELILGAAAGRPVIVAGSTTETDDNEEQVILDAWQAHRHEALLVLAPRHPERFEKVFALTKPYAAVRATDLQSSSVPRQLEIILLDTIGDLAALYSIATVAFVGGSLVARGGHNPLEPAQFGVPVLLGPHFENFRDMVTKMQTADAIRIVQNKAELEATFTSLLSNPDAALGERGRQVFLQQQGATTRNVETIVTLLAPTARLIPAWGAAPGTGHENNPRAEGPAYSGPGKAQ